MNLKNKFLSQSNQFNFYKDNYEALLNENTILKEENNFLKQHQSDKDMFKRKIRGSSGDVGKTIFLDWVLNNVERDERILDVGFGGGVYGKILKAFYYEHIDGVDAWSENIVEMGLNFIYDNIFIENVLDFEFDHYDLIIMGDVLEHISLKDSKALLNRFIDEDKVSKLFIQVPYMYENHEEWQGNPYEVHLQDEINEEYMEREFPFLELLYRFFCATLKKVDQIVS